MDILDVMMYIAAFTLVTVTFLILFGGKQRGKSGKYLAWNYQLKKLFAKRAVKKWQSKQQPLQPTLETEQPQVSDRLWDSLTFRGTAPDGTLVVLMLRQRQETAEVEVQLALPNGTVYRLPKTEEGPIHEVMDQTVWSAAGLKFTVLEPCLRWRLLYNGLLQQDGCDEFTHVRLNLIWTAASAPLRYPADWSVELATSAMAGERWRDGGWTNVIQRSGAGGGWEQWGCVQGVARIEETPEIVVRARGVRERWWAPDAIRGSSEGRKTSREVGRPRLYRAVSLVAAARDGNAVYLRAQSHSDPEAPSQALSGSIRMSNCRVETITWSDFNLDQFYSSRIEAPLTYTIDVGASRRYKIVINTEVSKKWSRSEGLYGLETIALPMQVSINGDTGYGILELGYESSESDNALPIKPQATRSRLRWTTEESLSVAERGQYCVHFSHPAAACPHLVGAKGASLALLSSHKTEEYSVPPGFCLTTHALERHISQHAHLAAAVTDIVAVNIKYDEAELREKCERAVKLFSETPIKGEVRSAIVAHLAELKQAVVDAKIVDDITFAVRSSAIGEDSEELSAAGQNDTVLGCRGEAQVLSGVQRCWSSLYSAHSTQYRRMHGQRADTGMGVVVQTVVPAYAAGVLFSRHPNSGHPARILLTANYGLGESVVSGQVEPDTIIMERLSNDVRILTTDVGKKSHRVVLSSKGETEEVKLSGDESRMSCLTEEECRRLGCLAICQERLWGAPRDLEWAIYKDKIFLVQARPITSLERWTEYELLHEFDTPVFSEEDLFTFANTGEVLPGALTPLTLSTMGQYLQSSTYRAVNRRDRTPFDTELPFFFSHYRMGINLYNTMYRRMASKIDAGVRVMEMSVHGHEVADESIHAVAIKRNPNTSLERVALNTYMAKNLLQGKAALKRHKELIEKLNIDKLETDDPLELYKHIEQSTTMMIECMYCHNVTTAASVFSQAVAMAILLEGSDQFSLDHLTDIGLMLSSCADVVSADVPTALAAIADGIHSSGRHEQFCLLSPRDCLPWLRRECPAVHERLRRFLEDHAHRNIKEFDLATKTWGIDPSSLLQSIQSAVKAMETQTEKKEDKITMSNREIAERVVSPKKSVTRLLLRLLLPLCQSTVARREGTKAFAILAVHKLRLACLRLATLMCARWLLPEPDLVFFFSLRELGEYLRSRDPAIIKKASQRQKRHGAWNSFKFAEMQSGHPTPVAARDPRLTARGGLSLRGTPVYPGEVVARACVVTDLAQIGQLQSGDILITHSTDIGWSPYFPLLGGVVTELGGLISHGAVIAREYGLPCIVGAEGATSVFNTGDLVLLAASNGTLEKIDQTSPADGDTISAADGDKSDSLLPAGGDVLDSLLPIDSETKIKLNPDTTP